MTDGWESRILGPIHRRSRAEPDLPAFEYRQAQETRDGLSRRGCLYLYLASRVRSCWASRIPRRTASRANDPHPPPISCRHFGDLALSWSTFQPL